MTFLARGVWGSLPMVTMSGPDLHELFDFQADLAQIDVEVLENVGGDAGAFFDQAQQDVFGADVFVVEALRFLVGELHHLAGSVRETFIHGTLFPSQASGWLLLITATRKEAVGDYTLTRQIE